ncbi:phage holin family protein [Limnobaculum xujianqingii]|uniref:phage holin family protein n=1 Tax=Limnobaculum xujianqingii TaxID=2738837 RepID=UPI001126CC75|nr:phage holin family protein [Limnobaculum xujianqingii]
MISSPFLLALNAVICTLIIARLFTYRRKGAQHRPAGSWSAYVLMVACFAVVVRIIFGQYIYVDWAETLLNITLCIAIFSARGNVMHIFRRQDNDTQ